LEDQAASSFTLPWRWRQQGPQKQLYIIVILHGVTIQKT